MDKRASCAEGLGPAFPPGSICVWLRTERTLGLDGRAGSGSRSNGSLAAANWVDSANLAIADANNSGLDLADAACGSSCGCPIQPIRRRWRVSAPSSWFRKRRRRHHHRFRQDDIALGSLAYDADPSNDLNVPIVCMACTSPAINNPNSSQRRRSGQSSDAARRKHWNFRALMDAMPQAKVFVGNRSGQSPAWRYQRR